MTDRVGKSQDDAHLARLASGGDRAAATALVERHQVAVHNFLRRLTGNGHLADDLTQETLFRMLRNAHAYDPAHPMKTWLLTIARRLWIDHLRRRWRRNLHLAPDRDQVSDAVEPSDAAVLREQTARLDRALGQLSEAQRCAVTLFYQQELNVEQVAAVMEMPEGTIKSHLHRGRVRLRQLLGTEST